VRKVLCLFSGLVFLLGGCRRATDTVARLAESTRTATEQLVFERELADEQRERRIDPYVGNLRHPSPLKLVERYETREGPDGLFIYDTQAHMIARIGGQSQSGLTLDQAKDAIDALSAYDAKHPGK
jgi:hypothetical protein